MSRIVSLLSPYYNNLGKNGLQSHPRYIARISASSDILRAYGTRPILLQGLMAGPLFESFCVQETIKVFFNLGLGHGLFYLRTSNDSKAPPLEGGLEVDTKNLPNDTSPCLRRGVFIISFLRDNSPPRREGMKGLSYLSVFC